MEGNCVALRHLVTPRRSRMDTDDEEEEVRSDQKENVYVDTKWTTPQKCDQNSKTLDQGHVTPSKLQDRTYGDPLTPTANLKMLISAASPDIRDREMRKILFRPIENESEDLVPEESDEFGRADEGADEFEKKPSRKQKSLGLLCQKFLALYPNYPTSSKTISISLDEVASNLGVERRRIYDIVNVLESLKLVSRVAKNQYVWHGRQQLQQTLRELHGLGKELRYHLQMEQAEECGLGTPVQTAEPTVPHKDTADDDVSSGPASGRKDKSLRIMSQKFVTLFLVSKTQTITLELAAKILIEESQDKASHSKYKTKVRRLYDIANVLTSLNLIKKVHVREERGRKPAFKWIGPVDFQSTGGGVDATGALSFPEFHAGFGQGVSQDGCPRLTRHVSFNVVPVPVPAPAQRRVSSAPSSPHRSVMGLMPEGVDFSRKAAENPAVCQEQFEESSRLLTTKTGPLGSAATLAAQTWPAHPDILRGSLLLPHLYPSPAQAVSRAPQREEDRHRTQAALTFFSSLPPSSLLMMYGSEEARGAGALDPRSSVSQSTEGVLGKRKADDGDPGAAKRSSLVPAADQHPHERRGGDSAERTEQADAKQGSSPQRAPCPDATPRVPVDTETPPTAHYLYVPNSTGLNKLNLLLPPGPAAGGLALSSSTLPAIALPYVLLPPSALPSYPLIAGSLPSSSSSFGIAGMVSPNHLVLGARSLAGSGVSEFAGSLSLGLLGPDQARVCSLAPPVSPACPQKPEGRSKSQPQTPLTPKEVEPGSSRAFFQTPGALGPAGTKAVRKRASAQRRLDISPPPTN